MDVKEIENQRKELEEFYNRLYAQDKIIIEKKAKEYANDNEDLIKAYLAGYKESIRTPHTRSIRLIVMYTLDFLPRYATRKTIKFITSKVRTIFREKLYPKTLII